jgi:hypothetical protein
MDESADVVLDNKSFDLLRMLRISDDSTELVRFPQENPEIPGSASHDGKGCPLSSISGVNMDNIRSLHVSNPQSKREKIWS